MGRMWKQYGKDVETICEGCGNNMNWKQYDQNFILPQKTYQSAGFHPSRVIGRGFIR